MLENAKIWRNIAPPMQLKPNPWKTTLILRLKPEYEVIIFLLQFVRLILYEFIVIISVTHVCAIHRLNSPKFKVFHLFEQRSKKLKN